MYGSEKVKRSPIPLLLLSVFLLDLQVHILWILIYLFPIANCFQYNACHTCHVEIDSTV